MCKKVKKKLIYIVYITIMTDYTATIKSIIKSYNKIYVPIPNECLYNIFELYVNNKVNKVFHSVELLYYGVYYKQKKDYDNMKKYFLMSIETGNRDAMYNYGSYFDKIKDYDNMKKYYLMAIEYGHAGAMYNYGCYCKQIKDYDNMKKFYLMAIENGNAIAMNNYGAYYYEIQDYDNMKKYWLMAIENGNTDAMNNYGCYLRKIKDYDNMKKYYLMAIENGNETNINRLKQYCEEEDDFMCLIELYYNKKMFTELIPLLFTVLTKEKKYDIDYTYILDILTNIELPENAPASLILLKHSISNTLSTYDLHFKYTVFGKGYQEAKEDFIKNIQ